MLLNKSNLYNLPNNFHNALIYDGIHFHAKKICSPKSNAKVVLVLRTTPVRVLSSLQDDDNSKKDTFLLDVLKSFVSLKYA